jgi:hypothetical protein
MCKQANHVLYLPSNSKTFAGALYNDLTRFPVARFYHLQFEGDPRPAIEIFELLKHHNFNVEVPLPEMLERLLLAPGWEQRVATHNQNRAGRAQDYEKIRAGRSKNTTTDSSFFLNSSGCIICDAPPACIASMTLSSQGESAMLSAIRLCSAHMDESRQEPSLAQYLAKKFNIPFFVDCIKRSPLEVLSDSEEIVKSKLKMEVTSRGKNTIKAKTNDGILLIYRFDGPLNYGYMLNGANNEELARIDSANHHQVEIGPDHLHPDLRNDALPVSSFTTGDLILDWPLIGQLIDQWRSTEP